MRLISYFLSSLRWKHIFDNIISDKNDFLVKMLISRTLPTGNPNNLVNIRLLNTECYCKVTNNIIANGYQKKLIYYFPWYPNKIDFVCVLTCLILRKLVISTLLCRKSFCFYSILFPSFHLFI